MRKYVFTFIMTLCIFIVSLGGAALIPNQALKNMSEVSADYYMAKEPFFCLMPDKDWTKVDYYADAILYNIAYHLDPKHPFSSSLEAAYYKQVGIPTNKAYKETVFDGKAGNTSYARYWHGSIVVLRLLLFFLSAKQIYILNGILLLVLWIALEIKLLKQKHYLLSISLLIATAVTGSYMIPFSIEYTTTFIIMLAVTLAIVNSKKMDRERWLPIFFMIGMITNFVDFLTTETVTLTVPLLVILCLQKEKGTLKSFKEGFHFSLRALCAWGIAYGLTWTSKWLIASAVLKKNVFIDALNSAEERTVGQVSSMPMLQSVLGVLRNIGLLFPMHYAATLSGKILLFIVTAFILTCFIYLYRRKINDFWFGKLLFIICLIPYIRYLVLGNHSFLHCFFTYRAQFPVMMSLVYLTGWSLDVKLLKKEFQIR